MKRFFLLLFFLTSSLLSGAQNLAQQNWYFGNSSNAIIFNRTTQKPSIITNKVPLGIGGSAVATDPATGDLLFYTDGTKIYDVSNTQMPLATGLNGNPLANQPAVICPMPGDSTKFFVFTNSADYTTGGTIKVSVVDMNSFGNAAGIVGAPPFGDILKGGPTNTTLQINLATALSGRSEGMTIIPNANRRDYWLLTHQNGTTNYTASLITPTSYNKSTSTFTFKKTVISIAALPTSVANFSANKKNTLIAVSAQDAKTDAIILKMDTTGVLALDRTIYNSGTATTQSQSIYDMQWDDKGQYLYISRAGEAEFTPTIAADVLQYDYNNPAVTLTSVLQNPIYRSWGLQLAPDSAIYHIYQATSGGPFLVEKFTKTDTIASQVVQTKQLFTPDPDFNGRQFPSFISKINIKLSISFTTSGNCQNSNIAFFPTVSPGADSLYWDLQDTTMWAWSPIYRYTKSSGSVNVKLIAYYQGQKDSVTQTVTVTPFSLAIQLPSDTTACHCQLPANGPVCSSLGAFSVTAKSTGANGAATYLWSDGKTTTAKFSPDSAGYYWVVAKDATPGCSTYAGVNIKEYGKQDQRSNVWYFGNKAGIDFTTKKALSNSAMDAPAGCAITCDRNGKAIIYTDGDNLYDKNDLLIASGLGGNPNAAQSSIIVSVPGDETLFYIFTNETITYSGLPVNQLSYSLYDLKSNSLLQKNVPLFSKSTERVTANGNWLVAHEYGSSTFHAYKITTGGIGDPVYTSIGSVHSLSHKENGQGYMKLGPKNNLAVALSTPGVSNLVELFHLNDSIGVITNYRKLDLNHPAGQVYGIEFSAGGSKLFASITGTPNSDIYEFSIDSLGHTNLLIDNPVSAMVGALQIAPDNNIYFAQNDAGNNNQLGYITPVETPLTTVSPVTPTGGGFPLASGTNSNLGLPNFRQQVGNGFGGPDFTFVATCFGDSTSFTGIPTDQIDTFQWFFGDGGSSTLASPKHLYAKPGTYKVILLINNRCLKVENKKPFSVIKNVKINAVPPKPSLPLATPLCTGAVTLHANTPANPPLALYKYSWSTGDTTESIVVNLPIILSVTNTDKSSGCAATANGIVTDNRPQVSLGPDLTVCQNSIVANLDAQNLGDNINWTIVTGGVPSPGSNTQYQSVTTATAGVFLYKVQVIDPSTGCETDAQKQFTIVPTPTFSYTNTTPATCIATGSITLTSITSPSLYTYTITGPTSIPQGTDQSAATQGPFSNLTQGTYIASVVDQVSGCTAVNTIGLTANQFTVTPSVVDPCDAPTIKINNNIPAADFPITYTITGTNNTTLTNPINAPAANFNVTLNSQGQGTSFTYTVQLVDKNGCIGSNSLVVNTNNPPALVITPNLCSNPATLKASGGSNYSWTSDVFSGSVSGSQLTITQSGHYKVSGKSSGCPTADSVTIVYNGPINPNFIQQDTCKTNTVLIASPTGSNFSYRWYEDITPPVPPATVPAPTQIGQQVAVSTLDDGHTFTLVVVDAQSGCSIASSAKKISVVGQVTAGLSAGLACDNGSSFLLTSSTNVTGATYKWLLNGSIISGAGKDTLRQTSAGTYEVDVTYKTCKASASIDITKAPIPIGELKTAYKICSNKENTIDSTKIAKLIPGTFFAYDWYKNNVRLDSTQSKITVDSPGKYSVELTNDIGCTNFDYTEVIDDCEPVVNGPNVFKPSSSDNSNKNFMLFTFFITDNFEVLVFDRWGEVVFESKDRYFNWNGGYKNNLSQPLPGGTYVYLVRYVSSYHKDQGVQEQRGGVVLLR